MFKYALPTLAAGMLAFVGFTAFSTANDKAEMAGVAKVGEKAPAFTLTDQDGTSHNLSDFAGKIVVLEWFNDQCPFVVKHYKNGDMNNLASKYMEKGVVWLAIDSSSFSSVGENKSIAGEWKIDRPLLDDSKGTVGKAYGAKTTPHMYIIDAEGTLVYAGAIDSIRSTDAADVAKADNYVAAALDELLAGNSVSNAETKPYGCSVKYGK